MPLENPILLIFLGFYMILSKKAGVYKNLFEIGVEYQKYDVFQRENTLMLKLPSQWLKKAGSPESWVYSVGIMQEQRGLHRPYLRYEKILHNNKVELTRPNLRDKKDKDQLLRTYLEQPTVNQSFRAINQYFESYKYFHIIPQLIQHPQAFTGPGMPEDPYGQHFLEYLAKTNSRIRKTRLDKIQSALKIAVPRLKDLAFVQDEFGYPHLEAQYDHWRPNAGKQREDQFSDGTLRLIGLLWSLIESGDSLLLLEEPELSLNSGIIRNLVPIIFEIQQKKKNPGQVIISTHSWDLLSYSGISGDEIFIISPQVKDQK